MVKIFRKMMIDQVHNDLVDLGPLATKPKPPEGWIATMRKALGMTTQQLASRLGCSAANLSALQQREKKGTISMATLESVAQAMNCRYVYFFVPAGPLPEILEQQARRVARHMLRSVQHSMDLEQQGLTPEQKQQQEDALVKALLEENPRHLWETLDEDK